MTNKLSGYLHEVFTHRFSGNMGKALSVLLLATAMGSCRQPAREPVTLTYLRLGWAEPDEFPTAESFTDQFTRDTGIRLKSLPVPETTLDQLELTRKLLQGGEQGPDVVNIDMIWSGVVEEDLIDLRPYLGAELSSLEPQLLPGYTVGGKLVAIPYQVQVGVLEYRADLLREYGFNHPPRTWDEMESMAGRIQAGERRKGNKDFWGYVWQGADAEALTCNALEWQVADGGGVIIESDGTISVNNPATIRSWQRARSWVGRISPPGVLAFREYDSINVFDSGGAAFNRLWVGTTITSKGESRQIHWRNSLAAGKVGYTSVPGGSEGWAGTLGGSGLAVSRRSVHPKEAIELVRFMIRSEIKSMKAKEKALASQQTRNDLSSASNPHDTIKQSNQRESSIVSRPSSVVGGKYEQVARAYDHAVHLVLTGQTSAPEAAGELEKQLVAITGFKTGPPKSDLSSPSTAVIRPVITVRAGSEL